MTNTPKECPPGINPELYARLQAEAKAPYRSLRRFIYISCGASGLIGAFIFLTQLLSGQNIPKTLGNLAIQTGVITLMIVLYRIDRDRSA